MPELPDSSTPWMRLLGFVTQALGDNDEGHNFATGLHLGLAIAIRHPEYAVAMNQAINETGMSNGSSSRTDGMVEALIESVPIERIG